MSRRRHRRNQRIFLVAVAFVTAWAVHAHDKSWYGQPMTGPNADNSDPICLLVFVVLVAWSFWATREVYN